MASVSRFKSRFMVSAIAAIGLGIASTPASASIDAPLPTDLYITFNGLDWAWASPCSPSGCSSPSALDLSYQGTQGWRVALESDFNNGPAAADFLTPNGLKCATPYFNDFYSHCDYGDGTAGYVWNMPGDPIDYNTSETWVVRAAAGGAVPEPATWAMMLLGFGAVGFSMRRKREGLLQQIA